VESVTIGRFNDQIVRSGWYFRRPHDGVVRTSQIPGEDDGSVRAREMDRGSAKDVAGKGEAAGRTPAEIYVGTVVSARKVGDCGGRVLSRVERQRRMMFGISPLIREAGFFFFL
jgi:hypothetical protein